MSNNNDDWGQGGGGQDGQGGGGQDGDWGQADEGWGQPEPQVSPPQAEQHSAPPAGQAPGQAPGPGAGQQPQQQPGGGQMTTTSSKKKFPKLETNDIIVLLLSFFLPGVGHMMLGQTAKGAVILAAVILTCGAGYIANILIVADAFFCLATKKEYGQLEDWDVFPNYQDYI